MKLDLMEDEFRPTHLIDGFLQRLETLLPSLYEHRCSEGVPGGFFERVREGTWLGHVIEHVALELQTLAGMPCGFGRTRSADREGVYFVVFTYEVERAGLYAAQAAVRLVEAIKKNQPYDVHKDIKALIALRKREGLGPGTQAIAQAALARGIPYKRLNTDSLLMLGQGMYQKAVQAAMTTATSAIGVDIASDKALTKKILSDAFIPVPQGRLITSQEELEEVVGEMGFPLVIKPLNANQGKGVTTNIQTHENAYLAFEKARAFSNQVIAERFVAGADFRFLVINYQLEAAAQRTPARIIGNGRDTVKQLIHQVNSHPNRGEGHEKTLTKITIDATTRRILAEKNLTLQSVLAEGEPLLLKDTANLSTGGTAVDVTEKVHPENVRMAERIARLLHLDICGIDVIAQDITQPITDATGAVIEVNAGPGLRMHLAPSEGMPRNVGEAIVNMLYPEGALARIPIVAVTGTNGKTTTTRLIAHLATQAGYSTGYTTTDGIYIQNQPVYTGDCSGPQSAEMVLKDSSVNFAVFECARGGILRAGLGFDRCNVSVITNITEDHLELDDIMTLEQMARVKSVVARSTVDDGYAILNADDDLVYGLKDELTCKIALFSCQGSNERILAHRRAGGWAAVVENGYFTLSKGEYLVRIAEVNHVPLTFGGRAVCMIKNILPAILAAAVQQIDIKTIRRSLQTFLPGPAFTPGRMNLFQVRDCEVLIDYVHNTDGFQQLEEFIKQIEAPAKVCIVGCAGDRRDEDIRRMGTCVARAFDEIIIRHDKDNRGRTPEELTRLISEGVSRVRPEAEINVVSDEIEALRFALNRALPGTYIVISSETVQKSIAFVEKLQKESIAERVLVE